jgi:ABC-type lipoprotein export system ATPase subunit
MVLALFASIDRELSQTVLMVSHEEAHRRYFERAVRGGVRRGSGYRWVRPVEAC